MKATELRIGNLIEYKIEDELDEIKEWWELNTVDAFDLQDLTWLDSNPEDAYFRPIKITEEWLLKFGFENITGVDYILHIDVDFKLILIPADAFYPQIDKADDIGWSSISLNKIEYIHQLQNLYFALTGKELAQVSEGKN